MYWICKSLKFDPFWQSALREPPPGTGRQLMLTDNYITKVMASIHFYLLGHSLRSILRCLGQESQEKLDLQHQIGAAHAQGPKPADFDLR